MRRFASFLARPARLCSVTTYLTLTAGIASQSYSFSLIETFRFGGLIHTCSVRVVVSREA